MLPTARIFFLIGLAFIVMAGLFYLFGRLGLNLGHLPGDIRIQGSNATCVIALGTSILLSIILTILLNVFVRLSNR
jgi:hypothetical protein